MEEKQKRILTIVFILLNVVLWSFFIIPRIGTFSATLFTSMGSKIETTAFVKSPASSQEMLQRIDFHTLRDPFLLPEGYGPKIHVKKTYSKPKPKQQTVEAKNSKQRVEKQYISRFKLKSIVEIDGKYMATLAERSHLGGSQQPSGSSPYSYRFSYGEQDSGAPGKSYMVIKGDNVMGETVVKITSDYVILKKIGKFYKLTFSGGFSVSSAN